MNATDTLYHSEAAGLALRGRGKVRDIFDIDADHMLIVTTDRISAFDCILPDPIPGKGRVLTAVSNFWFGKLGHIVPNHLSGLSLADILPDPAVRAPLEGRSVVVKKLRPLPVEAVVRGYLIGSGWKDYQATGAVCGIALPQGLRQAERLPEPIFTPSTKAEFGQHDQNIDFAQTEALLGPDLAAQVRDTSLGLYTEAAAYALERGIIIADTKFEFGLDAAGKLYLIDEALTPDSSRFWPVDQYQVGISPPSFDKQFVRDYLESLVWDKNPPAPHLPAAIIAKTAEKYREAQARLTRP
ncbi:phosphoribosylaminoimidazole-succinocarboxamide synthase [Methylomagnum ishizawai]|uniref:Phosphoribosylaminoimidazole-succinocarboxamide synthase n=1 Tax=Methylomagnum ishizawai TaxID=1760988 RepID=A0A1Y6D088_9GAMM|nr:phosphoribosylaminoimidazolesuccinocarboxamide synthase [Methylomagnum ishizawai]SMF93415.1 phosphoribosylaminoimidazole-succinocarboxamide synthase [Methylomagnum ishizawai]